MLVFIAILGSGLAILSAVVAVRAIDMHTWRARLVAYELRFPMDLDIASAQQWLANVAAITHGPQWSLLFMPPVGLEVSATQQGIRYYLLVSADSVGKITAGLRAAIPGIRLEEAPNYLNTRLHFMVGAEIQLTAQLRPLSIERAEGTSRAIVASLQPLAQGEEVRLSWIFGSAGTPKPVHTASPEPANRWWSGYLLDREVLGDTEAVRALRLKQGAPLLHATARLGVTAASRARAYTLLGRTYGTWHGMNAIGVRTVRRFLSSSVVVTRLMTRAYPVAAWPMIVSSAELAGLLGLPVGEGTLPGVRLGAARQLPPTPSQPNRGAVIALSNYPGMQHQALALHAIDQLRHSLILGPTGSGKSWLLTQLILGDIAAGHSVFAIDMKGDLSGDVLDRVNDLDVDRLTVIDPSKRSTLIGFNILEQAHDEETRELVVDNVLHIFKEIWAGFWGPRSDQLMRAALTTLTSTRAHDGSAFTLCEIVPLLTNDAFRRSVLTSQHIPDSLRMVWRRYEAMSDGERTNSIAPVLNKVEAFTSRSSIRLMLGQSHGIDLRDIFRRRSAVLVNLAKGALGSETSNLLGALLVSSLWQATSAQITVPANKWRMAFAYIDEAQDIVRLPVPMGDLLSQARGLKLGVTLALQFVAQLPDSVKAAVLGTVQTQVLFALKRIDAQTMAPEFAPLSVNDLMGLDAHEVAMRPCVGGSTLTPVTGLTLPLGVPVRDGSLLAEASRRRVGLPRAEVEASLDSRVMGTLRASAVSGNVGVVIVPGGWSVG